MRIKQICCWTLLALVIALAWYNHQYHCYGYPFITNSSGLSYKAIGKKSSGKKVQYGQVLEISIVTKAVAKKVDQAKKNSPKENVVFDRSEPFLLRFEKSLESQHPFFAEIIGMLQEHQQMVFKCSPDYYFKLKKAEDLQKFLEYWNFDKEDEFVTHIKLHKIMSDEEYDQMLEKRHKIEAEKCAKQLEKDKQLIKEYLDKHQIQATFTESGLAYIIDKSSESTAIVSNNTVKVNYTGRLLNGAVFDTSLEDVAKANNIYNPQRIYEPFSCKIGLGQVIRGWDEGLLLLKKNEKARFFIPSSLAYGERADSRSIPENSVLLFEVEVVDIV